MYVTVYSPTLTSSTSETSTVPMLVVAFGKLICSPNTTLISVVSTSIEIGTSSCEERALRSE